MHVSLVTPGRIDGGGGADEGLILVPMTVGEAS
jgi:hypothetical protein